MSNRDRIKILLILVFVICTCITCTNDKKYIKETRQINLFLEKNFGRITIDSIYECATDSIKLWQANNLQGWENEGKNGEGKLDSLICLNKTADRMVSAVLGRAFVGTMDGLSFFYGVKIKERWYFFSGATIFLPREMYEKNISVPLSFEKLHEIAMKEVFSGYLIKDDKGNWIINNKFFDGMENKNQTGGGYGSCFTCKTFEEYVIYLVNLNWQKK